MLPELLMNLTDDLQQCMRTNNLGGIELVVAKQDSS